MGRREIEGHQPCPCGCHSFIRVTETRRKEPRGYCILRCYQCGLMAPDPFPSQSELETLYQAYGEYIDFNYQQGQLAR